MKAEDFDLICAALAFTAVAITGDSPTKDAAQRAAGLAYLIKEFCRASVPEAFPDSQKDEGQFGRSSGFVAPNSKARLAAVDRMASAIAQLMRENDGCLPQDLIAKGFTPDEVDRHWNMAKALAHVELNMMDS